MTKREQYIAAVVGNKDLEYTGGFIYETNQEIKDIKDKAKGKYWFVGDWADRFCAYSPSGKRKYFEYFMFDWQTKEQTLMYKRIAKKAAKLWAQGNEAESRRLLRRLDKISERDFGS